MTSIHTPENLGGKVGTGGGSPWFVAADVGSAVGCVVSGHSTDRLHEAEKGWCLIPTPGGVQRVRVLPASERAPRCQIWGVPQNFCGATAVFTHHYAKLSQHARRVSTAGDLHIGYGDPTRDGEPWFVLADVCQVLEIANSRDAAARLDDDEKGVANADSGNIKGLGTFGAMPTIINESGLYSLILTSRKPAAKRFRKWVTAEVLPAIRRTGGYIAAAPTDTPEMIMAKALLVAQDTITRGAAALAIAQPKADALDRIATHSGSLTITEAAWGENVRGA